MSSFPIPRFIRGVSRVALRYPRGYAVHLVVPEQPVCKIDSMKITKNIGMLLLAVYLIIDGLLGFGLQLGPAIFLLYVVSLAAGIFIFIGR